MDELQFVASVLRSKLSTAEGLDDIDVAAYKRPAGLYIGITYCGGIWLRGQAIECERGCFKADLSDSNSIDKFVAWVRFCRHQFCDKCAL